MSTGPTGRPSATTSSDAPVYEPPVRGVRVKSRRRTRRMLSRLWLTQVATAGIIPSVVAALGYRDWADIPAMILMLVGAGTIAILPYWFMAGRAILNKDEGWAVPDSPANAGRGDAVTPADPAAAAAAASEATRTNPR